MEDLVVWLSMSGYAATVWPGYVVTLLAMAWVVAQPIMQHKRLIKRLRDEQDA